MCTAAANWVTMTCGRPLNVKDRIEPRGGGRGLIEREQGYDEARVEA
jgi:hypothetical protein